MTLSKPPNPGSREAVVQGCICAVIDNGHGRGYLGGMKDFESGETMFVVTVGCPLHSPGVVGVGEAGS